MPYSDPDTRGGEFEHMGEKTERVSARGHFNLKPMYSTSHLHDSESIGGM